MKVKMTIVTCVHETKYGNSIYTKPVKKGETVDEVVGKIMAACDYDEENPDYNEYFSSDIEEIVVDTDDFEIVE